MKGAIHFFVFIVLVAMFFTAVGFTSRVLWEYRIYAIPLITGFAGYIFTRKAWMGAIIAVITYFILSVVL